MAGNRGGQDRRRTKGPSRTPRAAGKESSGAKALGSGLFARISPPLRFLVATALAALITAGITVWVNAGSESRQQRQATQEDLRKPPLTTTAKYIWGEGVEWAMKGKLPPDAQRQFEQLTEIQSWSQDNLNRLHALLQQNGGVRFEALYDNDTKTHIGESTPLRIIVSGNRSSPVVIQDMHVHILKRESPISGSLFYGEPQGEGNTIGLAFNLDAPDPIALRTGKEGLPTDQPYFSRKFVTLQPGEPIVFNILAYTKRCYCEWELVIDTVVAGKSQKLVVRDEGQPFRTTALASSYGEAYSAFSTSPTHIFTRMPSNWTPLSDRPGWNK
jgi:hypothetical protein